MAEKIIGFYHGDCADGTTAAAVLLKKFPNIKLFPLKHHYDEKDFVRILEEIDGDTVVYTVDNVIGVLRFIEKAKEVTAIDHHISEKEETEALAKKHPNFTYVFDNDKSGASLTWDYFYKDEEVPEVIRLVEDLDLWNGKFGDKTKYISSIFYTLSNQPDEVLPYFTEGLDTLLKKGEHISLFSDHIISEFTERATPIFLKIGEHEVPAFNARLFVSNLGHELSGKYEKAVALFSIRGDGVAFSFRAIDGQSPTALDLAEKLGGGGHKLAAGAFIPIKDFCKMII